MANALDDLATLELDDEPGSGRAGRRFVQDQLLARGAIDVVDDAMIVTAELLANARQHGVAPIRCR